MDSKNHREYTVHDYKINGTKTENQHAKNQTVFTIEKPGMNESGIEAKKKGY